MAVELSERANALLRTLVESYIKDGQPVGSRALAHGSGLKLSPATVRNVMVDLEEAGLIISPHTSAGRVPTSKGYRLFVDSMVSTEPMSIENAAIESLKLQLNGGQPMNSLMLAASSILSGVTRMASVVMVPRHENKSLKHVEFLVLGDDRVLVIIVTNDDEVRNHVIHTPRKFTVAELQYISNYLNQTFAGQELPHVRERIMSEMREARDGMDKLMREAVEMADQVLNATDQEDSEECVISGQTNLMDYAELSNVEKLRQLFEAFNEKRDILHVLDQCLHSPGIKIFIGEESGYHPFDDMSVVTSTYERDGKVLGVLGVIGPTRMAYNRVIPVVDITAKLLSAALNQR
ncbi:MAG: heat-inducible transcriptional repressor HrcA [Gammaproteobacteria bacterium]|nr:MAG: heat-inducible transcriptional repressor HrcA [Gammaproteobacteria bacterium]